MTQESKGIVVFDLETTGVDVAKDRIVQIAAVKRSNDGTIEKKSMLINPGILIPPGATAVHHITDEMVKDAPAFAKVARGFLTFIEGYDISGYNIMRFDIPLLVEELSRAGVEFSFEGVRFVDVFNIYKKLNPRDLSSAYKQYTGKDMDGAHDALNDTMATMEILEKMIDAEPELQAMSKDDLSKFSMMNDNIVDYAGKFVKDEEGVVIFTFGKHRGEPVMRYVSFLEWMTRQDFTSDTKKWCRKFIGDFYSGKL